MVIEETIHTYVFVRRDISVPQQIVQACHACLELGKQLPYWEAHGVSNLVLLGVRDIKGLMQAAQKLDMNNIRYNIFNEPDNGMGYSAICSEPLTDQNLKDLFKNYKLWELESD